MGVGAARGKLLLLGEHAAVYGHPAVGVALPWTVSVTHTPGPHWETPDLGPYEPAVRRLVDWLVDQAAHEGLPTPPVGRLQFSTKIPIASGFGSSGALCASLVNLFFPDLPLGARDRLAWMAEGLFHGTPSGIDTALALREGWWALDPATKPVTARRLEDPGLVLVVGSVVRESDTKALVGGLARRQAADPGIRQTLDALGALATQAIDLWPRRPGPLVADLVNQARDHLRSLGLETPALTQVLEAGLGCPGALAGKLSGAGGGGAFFLVYSSQDQATAALPVVRQALAPDQWSFPPQLLGEGAKSPGPEGWT